MVTRYHRSKLYVPKEIEEKLGLTEGERVQMEVVKEGEARLRVLRDEEAKRIILEWLENPPNMGKIEGELTRREIYEDHPRH